LKRQLRVLFPKKETLFTTRFRFTGESATREFGSAPIPKFLFLMQWFYVNEQRQQTEVSADELKRKAESGELASDTLVWREGIPEWIPLSKAMGELGGAPLPPPPSPASGAGTVATAAAVGAAAAAAAPSAYQPAPQVRPTDGNAIGALICSILGFVVCPILFIVGIVMGNAAQTKIRASGGTIDGEGLAKAGVIIGWIGVGLMVLAIVLYVVILGGAVALNS
jgi:hypothetical protein